MPCYRADEMFSSDKGGDERTEPSEYNEPADEVIRLRNEEAGAEERLKSAEACVVFQARDSVFSKIVNRLRG